MVTIESATSTDAIGEVRDLFLEYQRALGVDLTFQDFATELSTLPGAYAPPRGRLLLARIAGSAVGCVGLRPVAGDTCEMKRLYVNSAGRGSGLGRLLAERAIAEAREIGYARMVLDTLPSMTVAHRLYGQLGFVEIAPYRYNPIEGTRFLALDL
jgi:putative acetyltransferase